MNVGAAGVLVVVLYCFRLCCCAVLCCAVLYCAVLCCVLLCCAVMCSALFCFAVRGCAVRRSAGRGLKSAASALHYVGFPLCFIYVPCFRLKGPSGCCKKFQFADFRLAADATSLHCFSSFVFGSPFVFPFQLNSLALLHLPTFWTSLVVSSHGCLSLSSRCIPSVFDVAQRDRHSRSSSTISIDFCLTHVLARSATSTPGTVVTTMDQLTQRM